MGVRDERRKYGEEMGKQEVAGGRTRPPQELSVAQNKRRVQGSIELVAECGRRERNTGGEKRNRTRMQCQGYWQGRYIEGGIRGPDNSSLSQEMGKGVAIGSTMFSDKEKN